MRAGDTVLHHPSGEKWLLAYRDGDFVSWCGYPEGTARVEDCTVVKACTDEEHRQMLESWAKKGMTQNDHRRTTCLRLLEALNQAYVGMHI